MRSWGVVGGVLLCLVVGGCAASPPRPVAPNERQAWLNCMPIVLYGCEHECSDQRGVDFEDADDRLAWLGQQGCPWSVVIGQEVAPASGVVVRTGGPSTYETIDGPTSTGGPVYVRGYYRRDGTYVRPHTRSRPRRR